MAKRIHLMNFYVLRSYMFYDLTRLTILPVLQSYLSYLSYNLTAA